MKPLAPKHITSLLALLLAGVALWGQAASPSFEPNWWQQLWPYLGYLLAVVLLIHSRLQRSRLRRRAQYRQERERTQLLEQSNINLKAAQAALQEAYRKLEEASLSDPLTGLRNRRFLTQFIGADIALVDREFMHWVKAGQEFHEGHQAADHPWPPVAPQSQDLIFILLDMDHFKQVNDNHGHSAGDKVLVQLSRLLETTLRDSDYLVRWGGEEFLIVARFCERSEAPEMAERIRQAVSAYRFDLGAGELISKTCSLGYAVYPFYPSQPRALTWEQVVDSADRALYIAKHSGRDCWVGLQAHAGDTDQVNPALSKNLASLVAAGAIELVSSRPADKLQL